MGVSKGASCAIFWQALTHSEENSAFRVIWQVQQEAKMSDPKQCQNMPVLKNGKMQRARRFQWKTSLKTVMGFFFSCLTERVTPVTMVCSMQFVTSGFLFDMRHRSCSRSPFLGWSYQGESCSDDWSTAQNPSLCWTPPEIELLCGQLRAKTNWWDEEGLCRLHNLHFWFGVPFCLPWVVQINLARQSQEPGVTAWVHEPTFSS